MKVLSMPSLKNINTRSLMAKFDPRLVAAWASVVVLAVCVLVLWPSQEATTTNDSTRVVMQIEAAQTTTESEAPNGDAATEGISGGPALSASGALPPAPVEGLQENSTVGLLPRIAADGRRPWQVYARPVPPGATKGARVAILVAGLGVSALTTQTILGKLPPEVTLGFDAQGSFVADGITYARRGGHETLLMLPMEPLDYPQDDPGPETLLSSLDDSSNIERLQRHLAKASGYVGVATLSGTRLISVPDKMEPVLKEVHDRGLMWFETRLAPQAVTGDIAKRLKMPHAVSSRLIDADLDIDPSSVTTALQDLERTAKAEGKAVGMVSNPTPYVLETLNTWLSGLGKKGFVLVPVTAVVSDGSP
ncbi:MAG: divergent polysaccharide deacetylase family protein [Alphaproteobacteria bacterium]|nr:MAG: divergent polysaccharide deacetylase family protein [Alphaproteobacteria bacterium]